MKIGLEPGQQTNDLLKRIGKAQVSKVEAGDIVIQESELFSPLLKPWLDEVPVELTKWVTLKFDILSYGGGGDRFIQGIHYFDDGATILQVGMIKEVVQGSSTYKLCCSLRSSSVHSARNTFAAFVADPHSFTPSKEWPKLDVVPGIANDQLTVFLQDQGLAARVIHAWALRAIPGYAWFQNIRYKWIKLRGGNYDNLPIPLSS